MDKKSKKHLVFQQVCAIIAVAIILLLLFQAKDFVVAAVSGNDSYDVRLEEAGKLENHQKVYQLFKNGEYYGDVDYNLYSLLDENGNTDYQYCHLISSARSLAFSVILGAMMLVVIVIVVSTSKGTPFTHKNANRIRLIGVLQFGLAIVPGLVKFLMTFFRFDYVSTPLTMEGFYMFVIGFAIMVIAQVFDHGVKLQEDIDSIA
ncbi:MAG: DUF2975 domain-containing protein [Lachnospiraceae bacterium]|nr:DUF2975 domain-containing protein [Lachnospiraceae bacterium]